MATTTIYPFKCIFFRTDCFKDKCPAYRAEKEIVNTPFGKTERPVAHPYCKVLSRTYANGWVFDLVIKEEDDDDDFDNF